MHPNVSIVISIKGYTRSYKIFFFGFHFPLNRWRDKNCVNLIYFSDGLYMTSKYSRYQILPACVSEKRRNKVRKRNLYTEMPSSWTFLYRKPFLKILNSWRDKKLHDLIYFSASLYMTSIYSRNHMLPSAVQNKEGVKLENEIYTPKCHLREPSYTENRF